MTVTSPPQQSYILSIYHRGNRNRIQTNRPPGTMVTAPTDVQPLLTTPTLEAAVRRVQALSAGIVDPGERRRMVASALGTIWRRERPYSFTDAAGGAPRVLDAVLFRGEWELLTHRVNTLTGVTDMTLVVEADRTFAGDRRAFSLTDAEIAARGWQDRVVALRVELPDGLTDRHVVEAWQRNHLTEAVSRIAGPADLVLLADIDEIPFAEAVDVQATQRQALGMRQALFFANHERIVGSPHQHFGAAVVPVTELEHSTPAEIREAARRPASASWTIRADAGVHLQYVATGGPLEAHLGALGRTGSEIESLLRDRDQVRAGAALDGYVCLVPDRTLPGEIADVDEDRLDAALEYVIARADRHTGRRSAPVPDYLGSPAADESG